MKKGTLAVISGFSGVGKGTIVKKLVDENDYALSVSATTRAPRPGEEDGVAYYFITKEEFERRIRENDFFEYASYVGNYYGTPRSFVLKRLEQGENVILEIESAGALKVKDMYPEAVLIYMLPPSMEELEERLVGRGTETKEVIRDRLHQAAAVELDRARRYDFLIINDTVESCTLEMDRLIREGSGIKPEESKLLDSLAEEAARLGL